MKKSFVILAFLLLLIPSISGKTPSSPPYPSHIAPLYFGPNAFPIPDMLDGRTSGVLKAEIYADSIFGTTAGCAVMDDFTADMFLRIRIPLFTSRVNLVIWDDAVEYYSSGPSVNELREINAEGRVSGFCHGDIYISTDIQILEQEKHWLDLSARAGIKTASGQSYENSRYYDCPGYFFDGSLGRNFKVGSNAMLRTSLSAGFMCWQTDNWKQNDAVMYGVQAAFEKGRFRISETWGGYFGWRHHGDNPMSLKTKLSWAFNNFSLNLEHQCGFIDWPFQQIRFGLEYRLNIIRR